MDELTIRVEGLDALEARLRQLPEEIARKTFAKALKDAGAVIQAEVVSRAPVKTKDAGPNSNSLPPGALKESINTRVTVRPGAGIGAVTIGPGKIAAHIARWIEFGWMLTGHKPGKRRIKQIPARPFLRPAFDASAQPAVDKFKASLQDGLEKLNNVGS